MSKSLRILKLDSSGTKLWYRDVKLYTTTPKIILQQLSFDGFIGCPQLYNTNNNISPFTIFDNSNNILLTYIYNNIINITKPSHWNITNNYYNYISSPIITSDSHNNVIFASTDISGIILGKYNSNSLLLYHKTFNTLGDNISLSVDALDNIYISYDVSSNTNIIKTNSSGNVLWQKSFIGLISHTVVDMYGNVYMAQQLNNLDILLTKLDSGGTIIWQSQSAEFNNIDNAYNPYITIDDQQNIYLVYDRTTTALSIFKFSTTPSYLCQYHLNNLVLPYLNTSCNINIGCGCFTHCKPKQLTKIDKLDKYKNFYKEQLLLLDRLLIELDGIKKAYNFLGTSENLNCKHINTIISHVSNYRRLSHSAKICQDNLYSASFNSYITYSGVSNNILSNTDTNTINGLEVGITINHDTSGTIIFDINNDVVSVDISGNTLADYNNMAEYLFKRWFKYIYRVDTCSSEMRIIFNNYYSVGISQANASPQYLFNISSYIDGVPVSVNTSTDIFPRYANGYIFIYNFCGGYVTYNNTTIGMMPANNYTLDIAKIFNTAFTVIDKFYLNKKQIDIIRVVTYWNLLTIITNKLNNTLNMYNVWHLANYGRLITKLTDVLKNSKKILENNYALLP